jgi:hypothetical protein
MVISRNLNQAAMLYCLGAKIIDIRDGTPSWDFILQVNPLQLWYEKHIGWINYRYYARKRVQLKEQFYVKHGRSKYFRGKSDGFIFNDVVRVKPFTERERIHLKL